MAIERPHRGWVRLLTILIGILTVIVILTTWVDRQLFSTSDWGDTSAKMLQNPEIQKEVADYAVTTLYDNVDVDKELKSVLPGELKSLSGPAAGGLRQIAGQGAERALQDQRIQSLWQTANETAHANLVAILENKSNVVDTTGGNVTLDLRPLIIEIASQVGLGSQVADKLPADVGTIQVVQSDELSTAQTITSVIEGTALGAAILLLLLMALAIFLSRGYRWLTLLKLAITLIIAAVFILILRSVAGGLVVNQLATPDVQPAASAAYDIGTSLLKSIAWSIVWAAFGLVVISWLMSPNRQAVASRRLLAAPITSYPAAYGIVVGLVLFFWLLMGLDSGREFLIRLVEVILIAIGAFYFRRRLLVEFPGASLSLEGVSDLSEKAKEKMGKAWEGRPKNISLPKRSSSAARSGEADNQRLDYLDRLATMKEKGVISEEEFQAEKTRILAARED